MPPTDVARELRPATLDDAQLVADLESLRDPSEPRDPVLLRYWWQMEDELQHARRWVQVRDGVATAYVGVSHDPWVDGSARFGVIRPRLLASEWSGDGYATLVNVGEQWLLGEGTQTAVARVREEFAQELEVLGRLGFREVRRNRTSELDLVARREHILTEAREQSLRMAKQGVVMHPISQDLDADKFQKLYTTMMESAQDIPKSVPEHDFAFDDWRRYWFGNPAIREDRFWIAREGDDIVGCSVLDCPVVRGVPTTAYTGTLRRVRGRGIARALKYQSMAQAIEAGYTRVRTSNDSANPPIIRINTEMGYQLVAPVIELHHTL